MTRKEYQARLKAEEELRKYWEGSRKQEYISIRKANYKLEKALYEMETAMKKIAQEAGFEIVDVNQDGELMIVVDRHVRPL